MKTRLILFIALSLAASAVVEAGTTVAYGSTVGAVNLKSDGSRMDESFSFQLGTFAGGFIPTASNTDLWLENWRALDSAVYNTQPVGGIFPPDLLINAFADSVLLEDNSPPFDIGGKIYIWGYDQRAVPGAAEWILVTDPDWSWPDGSLVLPAVGYSVGNADIAVIGTINDGGVEMLSASVTVPISSSATYEGWLASYFSEPVLDDPSMEGEMWGDLADPDGDGFPNLVEYFVGEDPVVLSSVLDLQIAEDGSLHASYGKAADAVGVTARIEWSVDLETWRTDGVLESVVGGEIQVQFDTGGVTGRRFVRLVVERIEG
ncbi:MAG: hypothetical protein ACI8T1_001069 [Verrucomicrobiales bacterium]|jgi:hypothetical protein